MDTIPRELILPPLTIAGAGSAQGILRECAAFGACGLLVHGRSLRAGGALDRVLAACPPGVRVVTWQHAGGEPILDQVDDCRRAALEAGVRWVAGIGGGSVLDIAKACAGLVHSSRPTLHYHDGAEIECSCTPFIAAPTTAGTGSESTIVSVLTNRRTGVKKSIRHPSFVARLVVLDPDLLAGSPKEVIAASGLDAFTQALEAFVSRKATGFTDTLSLEGLRLVSRSIEAVYEGAAGDAARDLLYGSYLAGMALSNARLGIVHGLAHPLGARYGIPHGAVCGVCLPHAIEFNREAAAEKYARAADAIGTHPLDRILHLLNALGVRSPFAGRPVLDRAGIVEETLASGSTAANPRPVKAADVEELLDRIFAG